MDKSDFKLSFSAEHIKSLNSIDISSLEDVIVEFGKLERLCESSIKIVGLEQRAVYAILTSQAHHHGNWLFRIDGC